MDDESDFYVKLADGEYYCRHVKAMPKCIHQIYAAYYCRSTCERNPVGISEVKFLENAPDSSSAPNPEPEPAPEPRFMAEDFSSIARAIRKIQEGGG